MNKVLLITNNEDIKNTLEKNLVLLRASDELLTVNYEEAPDVVYEKKPDIVIVHESDERERTFGIIKYLKEKRIFENTNIILLTDKYDRDFILNAYDEGIDDYITVNSDPSEMLIRTINCIKKSERNKELKTLKFYLGTYGIISPQSGFYSPKFAQEIFESVLINSKYSDYTFMVIAPDEEGKKEFSEAKITSAIQKSVRSGDFVAEFSGSKYYLLINSDADGAVVVFDKIKSLLSEGFTIKAGIAKVSTRKFSDVEKWATCALNIALMNNKDYIIYSDKEQSSDSWLSETEEDKKSYKFFKAIFNKKLENVITPVFYRLQKTYEDRYENTKIEQFTGEQQSVFRVVNGLNEGRLKIVYPGFSKIIIYITYSGLESPENREISIPINQIDQKEIAQIAEGFIEEFISYVSKEIV